MSHVLWEHASGAARVCSRWGQSKYHKGCRVMGFWGVCACHAKSMLPALHAVYFQRLHESEPPVFMFMFETPLHSRASSRAVRLSCALKSGFHLFSLCFHERLLRTCRVTVHLSRLPHTAISTSSALLSCFPKDPLVACVMCVGGWVCLRGASGAHECVVSAAHVQKQGSNEINTGTVCGVLSAAGIVMCKSGKTCVN